MIKKIKTGIILILIGTGIPSVLQFFRHNGELFSLTVDRKDELRQTEVDTLNSIYDLSKMLKDHDIVSRLKKIIKGITTNFETYADLNLIAEEFDKMGKAIDILLDNADSWHFGSPKDKAGKFFYPTPVLVRSKINIPFSYSIGIGLMFFIIGIGFIIISLIGREKRTMVVKPKLPFKD